ncbi:MAG: N-acetylmuramic acid 6-phosphate etherase, partial [Thermoprotei archaeon]
MIRALRGKGRVFYVGAGTSGRLGVIDRAELISTFGMSPKKVIPIIAGGIKTMFGPSEMAEDKEENGVKIMRKYNVNKDDVVIGISASGRTPYVIGALKEAKRRGATTVAITVNPNAKINRYADIVICPIVGPEVIMGSTRMKAGTAQKMILTMMSTAAMIKLGKVHSNLMVNLLPISTKLRERAKRIVMMMTGVSYEEAERYLEATNYDIKASILMIRAGVSYETAKALLKEVNGNIDKALMILERKKRSD